MNELNGAALSGVVKKIQKLLALAGNNPNEHEAKAAAEKAHRLLLEHNLDAQTVREQGGQDGEEFVKHTGYHARVRTTEQKFLFGLLQRFFFIKIVHSRQVRGGPVTFYFLGTKTNVAVAQYVHDFLIQEFKTLWLVYKRANDLSERERQSYYAGLAAGIELQLAEAAAAVCKERALVLVRDPRIDAFTSQQFGKLGAGRMTPARLADSQAIADGTEHGRQIRIRKGLESESTGNGQRLALGDGRKKA